MNNQLLERAHDEYEALGMLSYHVSVPKAIGASFWFADLTRDDVTAIRNLIRDLGEAIEALSPASGAE